MRGQGTFRRSGFTLVELLVTVSIIALLLAVLLPSLRGARNQAKLAVCAANLRQIGIGIHVYADDSGGCVPRGPEPNPPEDFEAQDLATNQLWIGASTPWAPTSHPWRYNGLGTMLASTTREARHFFCPADDNFNLQEEWPRIGTDDRAYGSYLYRQLDHLPDYAADGRLDRMGGNLIGGRAVRVEALALDTNSLGPGPFSHTNHRGREVNVLFRDGSVATFRDADHLFAIPAAAFPRYDAVAAALDQILTTADYAYQGPPSAAPVIAPAGAP
jgi:prepilin-type N-terminal cleavage/methylation domain-containing protein/prepilin-type processing-associated H-X9-DG protein